MANIIEITTFEDKNLDIYARLNENQLKQYRNDYGLFIAESPKVVERALNAGYIPVSILLEKKHIEGEGKEVLEKLSAHPDVPVYTAEFDVLTKLTGFQLTRGMLCAMKRPALKSVEEICQNARRIAILENVMNPTNIGAIFRSAAALNIDTVLLTPFCSDPLYRRAIRVSMGTIFQVPWTFVSNDQDEWLSSGIDKIKHLGFTTAAMALTDNSVSISYPPLKDIDKLAIILGTEGDGLHPSTIEKCDYTVKIPMSHGVDSLNVAAASAVAFWELGNK